MKNKLFIIAACFSLMAICGSARADINPGEIVPGTLNEVGTSGIVGTLSSSAQRVNTFAKDTLLRTQPVDLCGNGQIDEGEQCEFVTLEDGSVVEFVQGMSSPMAAAPPRACPEDTSCNRDTCRCEMVPICGDGRVAHSSEEQCESFDKDGNVLDLQKMTMLCQRSKTAGMDVPDSTAWKCNDLCKCTLCGNGVKDPGEDCDGTEGCNSECKMAPPPELKIQCSIKEYGALDADYINELNAQGKAIMEAAAGKPVPIDLFGQEIYSKMLVQIEFPNAVVDAAMYANLPEGSTVKDNLAMSGDGYVTSIGIYQLGGPVFNDLSKMVERPREDIVTKLGGSSEQGAQKALLLFPRGSAAAVPKGKSLIAENEAILVPDVSASFPGMQIQTDLGTALQDTNVTVVGANQGSINGVVRFMVATEKPSMVPKAQGATLQAGYKTVVSEITAWPAPGGWGDPTGELIHHDPNAVLAALQTYVNEQKAVGNTDFSCDIAMKLTGVPYEPQMFERFAAVSDNVKVDPATGKVEMAAQQVQPFGFYSVMTEGAYGGRATSPCSLTGAEANVPQILVTLSMMVASIAGVGIIRRRKK